MLVIGDMIHEIYSQLKHKILNIQPRISRGISYIPTRAGTNIFMREINTETLIGDMMIGDVDVAYSTYLTMKLPTIQESEMKMYGLPSREWTSR